MALKPHELLEKMTDDEKVALGSAIWRAALYFTHAWSALSQLEGKYGETNTPNMAKEVETLAVTLPISPTEKDLPGDKELIDYATSFLGDPLT